MPLLSTQDYSDLFDDRRSVRRFSEEKRSKRRAEGMARTPSLRRNIKRGMFGKMPFDYSIDFTRIDFRKHPERYQIGRGEQGVFLVEPYKSELLPHWRFRTPIEARKSANALYELFKKYRRAGDFVGMDMARKYLQMGFTRSRRYANHKAGRKYSQETGKMLPRRIDTQKALAAKMFYAKWRKAVQDKKYIRLKAKHQKLQKSPNRDFTPRDALDRKGRMNRDDGR